MPLEVWTVGHSNRSGDEFTALLGAYGIEALADVRRFPGSRKHPQFGGQLLAEALQQQGVAYAWLAGLGGRRRPNADSPNSSWRNPSFRAYADHVASQEFADGLAELLHMASACRTAMMCSEVLWWRCHRALISDVLLSLGVQVMHILGPQTCKPHAYTPPARIVAGELTYLPAAAPALPCADC
jgi:uncharacterized protein (DUF488 family)